MRERILLLTLLAPLLGCAHQTPPPVPPNDPAAEITAMLRSSARSWNQGDLEGFLDDYMASDSTTFVTGSGLIHGVDAIRQRYRTGYWSSGRARDQLRFENLQVRALGNDHALATGRYVLFDAASDSTTGTGFFSLVLERTPGGWKIIHDHSSSAS